MIELTLETAERAARAVQACSRRADRGVIACARGTVARLAPPLCITRDEADLRGGAVADSIREIERDVTG